MRLALLNGKAFIKGKLVKKNILIENGKIKEVSSKKISAEHEIDCTGKTILPGAIDLHVHFRTPGFEQKEDWFTGSLAALHGGVTTVMDMPNTKPKVTTKKAFDEKKKTIKANALVGFDIYMAAEKGNLGEIKKAKPRAVKLYYGSTTGDILLNDGEEILELFRLSKKQGFIVAVHAEDDEEIGKNERKFANEKGAGVHAKIRTGKAEANAIREVLALQEKAGNKVHIAHVSSKEGLEEIAKAKKRKNGKNITCETTPNYLFLDSRDYKKLGNLMKCNPAVKGPKDREALWKGILKGTIDVIATDHAPHEPSEKKKAYKNAPSGIPGIETMLPKMIDASIRKKIPLKRAIELISENPANIFGWKKKGKIQKDFDADLVIIDLKKTRRLSSKGMFTKAGYTPFSGESLKGVIENTIVRGNVYG